MRFGIVDTPSQINLLDMSINIMFNLKKNIINMIRSRKV